MINALIDFCAYGSMLEDYYDVKKSDVLTEEESEALYVIIEKEIEAAGEKQMLELCKTKFRESVNTLLGN